MKTRSNSLRSLLVAAALVPVAASAELAVTTQGVNMRAGPDVSYPQVAFLGRGVQVDVVGCAEGWQWCDVLAGPNRGWVSAGFLSYSYYNQPTVISYGGPMLGIPLVSFSIGNYWDNYYRGRPFWNNRSYWYKPPRGARSRVARAAGVAWQRWARSRQRASQQRLAREQQRLARSRQRTWKRQRAWKRLARQQRSPRRERPPSRSTVPQRRRPGQPRAAGRFPREPAVAAAGLDKEIAASRGDFFGKASRT
jgi:uncharacterized protein YraI